MNNTGALFARVTKVMQTVKALEPDKKHQQGYMYISSDKALNMIGAAMAQNGLVIVPSVTSQTVDIVEYTNQQNKAMTRFDASVTFAMTLADSDGNDNTAVWVGAGSDFTSPDKAVYKAITSGHKYFMLKLFVVGAGAEDSEHEEAEPGRVQKVGRQTSNPVTTPANGKPAPVAAAGIGWDELKDTPHDNPITVDADKVAMWRGKVAKNPRATVGTVCSAIAAAGIYADSYHALNAALQISADLEKSTQLSQSEALSLFDRLVARKQAQPEQPALIDADTQTDYAE